MAHSLILKYLLIYFSLVQFLCVLSVYVLGQKSIHWMLLPVIDFSILFSILEIAEISNFEFETFWYLVSAPSA